MRKEPCAARHPTPPREGIRGAPRREHDRPAAPSVRRGLRSDAHCCAKRRGHDAACLSRHGHRDPLGEAAAQERRAAAADLPRRAAAARGTHAADHRDAPRRRCAIHRRDIDGIGCLVLLSLAGDERLPRRPAPVWRRPDRRDGRFPSGRIFSRSRASLTDPRSSRPSTRTRTRRRATRSSLRPGRPRSATGPTSSRRLFARARTSPFSARSTTCASARSTRRPSDSSRPVTRRGSPS